MGFEADARLGSMRCCAQSFGMEVGLCVPARSRDQYYTLWKGRAIRAFRRLFKDEAERDDGRGDRSILGNEMKYIDEGGDSSLGFDVELRGTTGGTSNVEPWVIRGEEACSSEVEWRTIGEQRQVQG